MLDTRGFVVDLIKHINPGFQVDGPAVREDAEDVQRHKRKYDDHMDEDYDRYDRNDRYDRSERHDRSDRVQREVRNVCNEWKRGRCMRGSSCRFAHPTGDSAPLMPMQMGPMGFVPPPLPPLNMAPSAKRVQTATRAPTRNSTKLVIDKIPVEYCTIAAVHDHFARFGTIVNIDLMPEQNRAKLQYSEHEAARAAFSSPEVIFNNRFVRVYWENEITSQVAHQQVHQPAHIPVQPPMPVDPQTELLRKRQETLGAYLELQKQKEVLLQKYLGQQKALLESLSNPDLDEGAILKLKAELTVVEDAITMIKPPKAETSPVEPQLRGGPALRTRGRGRGSFTLHPVAPHVPKPVPASFKLDLRPKTIKMTPIPPKLGTDPGSIRKFFEPYGQLTNLVVDEPGSSTAVTFVKREDAEKAMFYLTKAEEGTIFTWENTNTTTNTNTAMDTTEDVTT